MTILGRKFFGKYRVDVFAEADGLLFACGSLDPIGGEFNVTLGPRFVLNIRRRPLNMVSPTATHLSRSTFHCCAGTVSL